MASITSITSITSMASFYKPTLRRTLSHVVQAKDDAFPYQKICQEGESILTNFWVKDNMACISYMIKINGLFEEKEMTGNISTIPRFWKYRSCPFDF